MTCLCTSSSRCSIIKFLWFTSSRCSWMNLGWIAEELGEAQANTEGFIYLDSHMGLKVMMSCKARCRLRHQWQSEGDGKHAKVVRVNSQHRGNHNETGESCRNNHRALLSWRLLHRQLVYFSDHLFLFFSQAVEENSHKMFIHVPFHLQLILHVNPRCLKWC